MKYLKNNGLPTKVTIYNDRERVYKDRVEDNKGTFNMWKIQVIMWRGEGPMEAENADAKKFSVGRGEKLIRRYRSRDGGKNFSYVDERRAQMNHSFQVDDYPHIVGFKIGNNVSDEREYNILCGQTAKIENDDDAKTILDKWGFVDEVDDKGKVIWQNRWEKDAEQAKRGHQYSERTIPAQMENFKRPMRSDEKTRITEMKELGREEEAKF